MEKVKIDQDEINGKITKIFEGISRLDEIIEKTRKKSIDIKKIFLKFQENKTLTLHQTNSYLQFQLDMLKNEQTYHQVLKTTILEKISKEMIEIHDYIIMMISSLENLEIDHDEDKHNLIEKVTTFKKSEKIECSSIIQLITTNVKNLELVYRFVEIFEEYIEQTNLKNLEQNIHCNSFNSTLLNKKNHILLEYTKYCEQLEELVNYFLECSGAVLVQLDKQKITDFLVEKK